MLRAADRIAGIGAVASSAVALLLVVLVFAFLLVEALPLLARVGPLEPFSSTWAPREGRFGLLLPCAGTALVVGLAALLAVPLGLGAAAFSAFVAPPWLRGVVRVALGVLAGVPSVVFGWWGLTRLAPLVARIEPPGVSVLAGAVVLGLMVLPTFALFSEAALTAVPVDVRRAASALGLSTRAFALHVALPAARRGLFAALLLTLVRALGETMAALMVMGNAMQLPASAFEPARALPAHIALEMAYAAGDHRRGLFLAGLLLFAVVSALVLAVDGALRGGGRR